MKLGRNDKCFCGSGKKAKFCHIDIDTESRFAELVKLYTEFDNLVKQEKLKGKCNTCKENCNVCCKHHFDILEVEFDYIAYQYAKRFGIDKWNELTREGYKQWIVYREKNPEQAKLEEEKVFGDRNKLNELINETFNNYVSHDENPCSFLGADGKCTIYDFRPFVCRFQGFGYLKDAPLKSVICEVLGLYSDNINEMIESSEFFNRHSEMAYAETNKVTMVERMHCINYMLYYSVSHIKNPLENRNIIIERDIDKKEYGEIKLQALRKSNKEVQKIYKNSLK